MQDYQTPGKALQYQHYATDNPARPERAASQPDTSKSILDTTPDGLTLTVPPAGIFRGSKGLMWFAIFWTAFDIAFASFWFGVSGWTGWSSILPATIVSIFFIAGIAMVVASINMGRRRAIFDVIGDTLIVSRKDLFGIKTYEWTSDQLRTVRVGPSGIESDGKPLLSLHIVPKSGKRMRMLTQLDDVELEWIADVLRTALGKKN